ncbi:MAG: hypothetical protein JSW72_00325 [Candidatus Bathyarchaeota archaeon]|nr:MAG: hypothetical protein JSW72_00325 [Candidatus Bathyarchaeota archaeon]
MSSEWEEKLGSACSISSDILKQALEELSESCYGDANTSKKVIEELALNCQFSEDELSEFIRSVSRNCPMDAKKLHNEVTRAKGKKALAFDAVNKVMGRPL